MISRMYKSNVYKKIEMEINIMNEVYYEVMVAKKPSAVMTAFPSENVS